MSDVTTGELDRRLARTEAKIDVILDKMDAHPTEGDVERRLAPVEARVDKLEQSQTWLMRLVMGAILTLVLRIILDMAGSTPPL